jgi:Uma2 family endonuclease
MSTSVKLSIADYDRMIREGRFEPREEHEVELIEGEILTLSPIGPAHEDALDALNEWSILNGPLAEVRIRVQNSIGVPELASVPQPDLAWVRRRSYARGRPDASDLLLLVEVSDSSLAYDRGRKARIYPHAGVDDYWIVNIPDECVEVRRDPLGNAYRSIRAYRAGDSIPLLAFPAISFPVSTVFPA